VVVVLVVVVLVVVVVVVVLVVVVVVVGQELSSKKQSQSAHGFGQAHEGSSSQVSPRLGVYSYSVPQFLQQ
jgi:flagellar basal body-associated protein FliL